jgi:hypothetical protein
MKIGKQGKDAALSTPIPVHTRCSTKTRNMLFYYDEGKYVLTENLQTK